MTKREFIQQAALQFAGALVKVYDEQASGLVENLEIQSKMLASNATTLAFELAEKLEFDFDEIYLNDFFDPEVRIRIK